LSPRERDVPGIPRQRKNVHVGFDDPPRPAKRAKTEAEAFASQRRVREEFRTVVRTLPDALAAVNPKREAWDLQETGSPA